MKKLCLLACVVLTALTATAEFMVIRWNSGMCQVWDTAAGAPRRQPGRYVKLVGGFSTWIEALAAMNGLHTQGQCGWVSSD